MGFLEQHSTRQRVAVGVQAGRGECEKHIAGLDRSPVDDVRFLHDPNDEMVLETAVNGQADILVTFNLRDFGTVPERFGVELLLPRVAIGRIER